MTGALNAKQTGNTVLFSTGFAERLKLALIPNITLHTDRIIVKNALLSKSRYACAKWKHFYDFELMEA